MPTKVLVFESDPAFAGELRTELDRLGLVAQVVDDGYAGLMAAASDKPDLILLSIELPRMNGFSVCNKLKKDPSLKDVPLIIMSSESSDDTFEQHRKLRTRAEDYVHKPIAFGELLEHMRPYVRFENGEAIAASEDSGIVIDDSELTIEGETNGVPSSVEIESGSLDAEVEAFANTAFDHLLEGEEPKIAEAIEPEPQSVEPEPQSVEPEPQSMEPEPQSMEPEPQSVELEPQSEQLLESQLEPQVEQHLELQAEQPLELQQPDVQPEPQREPQREPQMEPRISEPRIARASLLPRSSVPPRPTVDAEVERLQTEVERHKTDLARLERELSSARVEVQRLTDDQQREAASNEQVLRLQRELDEIRLKAASGQKVGGVSSREFLDLREALNKKEKEILSLRDQITRKEKELLDASDTALALERDKADLEDRIFALDKDVQSAKVIADTAKADKEQAAKRAEDFKTRGEKVKAELEAKLGELATIQQRHEEEKGAALAELREGEQRSRDEALAKMKEEADADKAATLEARVSDLQREAAERLATTEREAAERLATTQREAEERYGALSRSSEEEQTRLKNELAAALADAESAKARLGQREAELSGQGHQALEALRAELEARHTDQLREAEARAAELSNELSARTEEREVLAREVSQLKEKVGRLEGDLAQRKVDLGETRDKLAEQTQRLEAVTTRWAENRSSLEHAKDALAAAVAQIEEAEARGV